MPETPSNMLPLQSQASPFSLLDTKTQKMFSLSDCQKSMATVIMFLSNHCPYVKNIQAKLVEVAYHYQAKGVNFIAICSNDVEQYPDDGPEKMRLEAEKFNYPFPYLYDETQVVAKQYQAACTPDFYIFDSALRCVYRGRFDESTPGNHKLVTGADLSHALDCLLSNEPILTEQKPSLGCNIKWKLR